jgi:hypothetical protein
MAFWIRSSGVRVGIGPIPTVLTGEPPGSNAETAATVVLPDPGSCMRKAIPPPARSTAGGSSSAATRTSNRSGDGGLATSSISSSSRRSSSPCMARLPDGSEATS